MLGLRYEYNSVPYEVGNRMGVPADYGNLYGHFVLNPQPLYQPDYLNFGPRLGVAYRVSSKTVLRGGLGIFSNMIPTCYPDQDARGFPLASFSYLYPSPATVPYSLTPPPVSLPALTDLSGNVMPPQGNTKLIPPNTPVNVAPIAAVVGPISGYFPSDRMRNGYTINGNATVEHEFPGSIDLRSPTWPTMESTSTMKLSRMRTPEPSPNIPRTAKSIRVLRRYTSASEFADVL